MPKYTPLVELAARKLCSYDGRKPDKHCPEAPREGNRKPTNLDIAARNIIDHLACQHAIMEASAELDAADGELTDPDEPGK